jgi:hypothetical protein
MDMRFVGMAGYFSNIFSDLSQSVSVSDNSITSYHITIPRAQIRKIFYAKTGSFFMLLWRIVKEQ